MCYMCIYFFIVIDNVILDPLTAEVWGNEDNTHILPNPRRAGTGSRKGSHLLSLIFSVDSLDGR